MPLHSSRSTKAPLPPALGAAYLAGLAVGFWKNRAKIARLWSADRTSRAKTPAAAARRQMAGWHRAVARAKSRP